jgi:hypothetical protein
VCFTLDEVHLILNIAVRTHSNDKYPKDQSAEANQLGIRTKRITNGTAVNAALHIIVLYED